MPADLLNEVRFQAAGVSGFAGFFEVGSGDQNGVTIDRIGFASVGFLLAGDNFLGGVANFYMQHSDDNATWVDIPVELLRNRSATATAGGVAGRVGSVANLLGKTAFVTTISNKRYVRIRQGDSGTPTGSVGVTALRFNPVRSPVSVASW